MMRSPLLLTVLLWALLGPGPARAIDLFPRGVYWPQERLGWLAQKAGLDPWVYADRLMAQLAERDHVNFLWTVNTTNADLARLADLAARHGLQVAGTPEQAYWYRAARTPQSATTMAEGAFSALGRARGLYAYVLPDEARSWELPYFDEARRQWQALDPGRRVLLVSMTGDTPAAIFRTGLDPVTCDVYPFFSDGVPSGPNPAPASRAYYRLVTEKLAGDCAAVGKTFWVMPQVFFEVWGDHYYDPQWNVVVQPGCYLPWRMPTVGETRWQIWQGLAAGARGVLFFVLFPEPNDRTADSPPGASGQDALPRTTQVLRTDAPGALLRPDSTPTPQMQAMAEGFAALERLEPILRELRPAEAPVACVESPFYCRTFRDAGGDLYVLVVNDDTEAEHSGGVTLLPGLRQVEDLRTGRPLRLRSADPAPLQRVSLRLAAGDGTLLKLSAPPATRPCPTYVEDFSLPRLAGEAQDAQAVAVDLPWGIGRRWQLVSTGAVGTLTCDLATLLGDLSAPRTAPAYLAYSGESSAPEGIEVSFSADGAAFTPTPGAACGRLLPVPAEARQMRFTLREGAALYGFTLVATAAGS